MTHSRISITFTSASLLAAALAIAACGGGGYAGGNSTPSKTAGAAVVSAKPSKLGTLLVGPTGRTLYLFEKDEHNESYCRGACTGAWPPLTTSAGAKAGAGASAGLIGTTRRDDGKTQVTYAGHPVYYYDGDSSPGNVNGQGLKQFGAEWYVLSPKGKKIEHEGKSS
jgi:predicted lipoprotein with Yx(FWY)xxD motif